MAPMSKFGVRKGVFHQPERILLYGSAGAGKTTWASCAPDPFFVDLDRGSQHVDVARNEQSVASWGELTELLHALGTERHGFQTLVLDTLDKAQALCWEHLCEHVGTGPKNRRSVKTIEEVNGGYGKGYITAAEEFRKLFALADRCWARGMRVIFLAHAKQENVKNLSGPDYGRWTVNIHKDSLGVFMDSCDAVMYATRNVIVKKDGLFDDKRYRAIGGESRVVHTQESPTVMAKNRYGLPERLPLDWDEFVKAVAEGHTPQLLEATIRDKARRLGDAALAPLVEKAVLDAAGDVRTLTKIGARLDARLDQAAQARAAADEKEEEEPAARTAEPVEKTDVDAPRETTN